MKVRYWRILLIALLLCGMLISCTSGGDKPAETTAPVKDETPQTGIEVAALEQYRIIHAEKADSTVYKAASDLSHMMADKIGVQIPLNDDFYREGVPGYSIEAEEILIGVTNRPETAEFLSGLKMNDYGYAVVNGKLVIAGYSSANTYAAFELFRTEVLEGLSGDSKFLVTDSTRNVKISEYAVDTLTLCGKSIDEFTVVYDKDEDRNKAMAEMLSAFVASKVGYVLPVEKSTSLKKLEADQPVIYIGRSDTTVLPASLSTPTTEGQYLLAADTTDRVFVLAAGGTPIDTAEAVLDLMGRMIDSGEKTVSLTLEGYMPVRVGEKDTLTAMSFNVWVSSVTDERKERVTDMIEKYMPDTIGVQEASVSWMNYLKKAIGNTYACVGVGRDANGSGEHSAIFYAKDKFKLIESDTKWLSATPDVPSKFEESSLNRIYTYAILERKSDGKRFLCLNTHLEHTSEEARVLQAEVLLEFLTKHPDLPVVCTGDFNTTKGGELYKTITSSRLVDGAEVAFSTDNSATFHAYGESSKIIDFCFVSRDSVLVDKYFVCDEKINGDYVSDHHPVMIEYRLIG